MYKLRAVVHASIYLGLVTGVRNSICNWVLNVNLKKCFFLFRRIEFQVVDISDT